MFSEPIYEYVQAQPSPGNWFFATHHSTLGILAGLDEIDL